MPIVQRARKLAKAGWSYNRIRQLLAEEFGVCPARNTIAAWVSDEFADRRRETAARSKLRHPERHWTFGLQSNRPEYRAAFIVRLGAEGVPVDEIVKVCSVVFGAGPSDDELSAALDEVAV